MQHYNAIGGLSEALGQHADEAFNELGMEDQETAEVLFKALTGRDPANREYRRPTSVLELCEIANTTPERMAGIIDVFRREDRAFLVPPAGIPLTPGTVIDISHESLIRNWKRLKHLVSEEAESARQYMRLADTAVFHSVDKAGLWRNPDLALALRWRERQRPNPAWARRYHPDFELAMGFLDQSKKADDQTLLEEAHP